MHPSTHLSLLEDFRQTDLRDRAWAAFQERYRATILLWCRRRLQEADAEDLTQDILIKLFAALPEHQHDPTRGRFRAWLAAVVRNAVLNRLDQVARHPDRKGVGGSSFLGQLNALAEDGSTAELASAMELTADPVLKEAMGRAKALVKPETWDTFRMVELDGRPARDVADELGVKVGAVFRAKYRFRDVLKREYRAALSDRPDPAEAQA